MLCLCSSVMTMNVTMLFHFQWDELAERNTFKTLAVRFDRIYEHRESCNLYKLPRWVDLLVYLSSFFRCLSSVYTFPPPPPHPHPLYVFVARLRFFSLFLSLLPVCVFSPSFYLCCPSTFFLPLSIFVARLRFDLPFYVFVVRLRFFSLFLSLLPVYVLISLFMSLLSVYVFSPSFYLCCPSTFFLPLSIFVAGLRFDLPFYVFVARLRFFSPFISLLPVYVVLSRSLALSNTDPGPPELRSDDRSVPCGWSENPQVSDV